MFTLQQMKAAHAKVQSGSDFPAYVQEIKKLGLTHYDFLVKDGKTVYHGNNGFKITGAGIYADKVISHASSPAIVRQIISEHQLGGSDFLTFCELAANAGVEKWVVDTDQLMCTYYDLSGNIMVAEPIPDTGY